MATTAPASLRTVAASAAARTASKYPLFIPRVRFELPTSLPRSYFLGHHRAGLEKMKSLLGSIDLVVECRDYRIPWTGRNALFEQELGLGTTSSSGSGIGSTKRIVVLTKYDLGDEDHRSAEARECDALIRSLHHPTPVHFSSTGRSSTAATTHALLEAFRIFSRQRFSLTGHRVLVAGMPNVGKSTLLNALRAAGLPGRSKGKVAKTGAQPGVTRRVGTGVKILEADNDVVEDHDPARGSGSGGGKNSSSGNNKADISRAQRASGEGVYLLDTPGVFMPYVPSAISMLKLALVGSVKDSLIPPITLADFLLFNINLRGDPGVYAAYTPNGAPTNDVLELLDGVGRRTGRLMKGGEVDVEGAAVWLVQKWRQGSMGRFMLDDVVEGGVADDGEEQEEGKGPVSFSQARKLEKERRRETSRAKWLDK